jgi:hemerythrin
MLERNKEVNQFLLHEQHLQLYRLVEQLDSVIVAGVGGQCILSRTLLALEEYTKVHFGDEEKLMPIHGYHSLSAHRASWLKLSSTLSTLSSLP